MTIGDAANVNVLLRALYEVDVHVREDTPDEENLRRAAAVLAERASKALGAGITRAQIEQAPRRGAAG